MRGPRVFGASEVHTYVVAARGQGAPVVVEGTVRARPVFRGALVKVVAALTVVALWVALAVVAIPRITESFSSDTAAGQSIAGGPDGAGDGTDGSGGRLRRFGWCRR